MSYTIRQARTDDADVLCRLMEQLSGHGMSREQMLERLRFIEQSAADSLYVCEWDGRVAGCMGFRIRENIEDTTRYGEVSVLVVDEEYRNRGAGRFMMNHAEKLASGLGCIGTWLVSGFGREEEAHAFYRKLGYKINGYRFVKPFIIDESGDF